MDKKGNGNKEESAAEDLYSQASLTASLSTTGERASRYSATTHLKFLNIRLTPKIIEFVDAFEGKQFTQDICIQNVGKNPILIKIGEPKSFIFQLKKPSQRCILLASGCSVCGTVSYTYHNGDLVQSSQIPLHVNGRLIYYPIVVKTAQPEIIVDPQKLHFKVINLGASAKSMILTVTNNGGIRTKFEVDLGKNPLGLVVHPSRGTIKPKQSTEICVEMMGLIEGEFYQELWLYTTGVPIRIPVLVEVVWPRLKIVYPKGTEEITLIDFRPTFVGTQRVSSFILNNFGAENTPYVILAEVNGESVFLSDAKNTTEAFRMFVFGSEEGFLQPFENRMLTVLFCPKPQIKNKGWHGKAEPIQTQREFIIFIRINRVHCLEWKELAKIEIKPINSPAFEDKDSFDYKRGSGNTREGLLDNFPIPYTQPRVEILRICLHGQAIEPDIQIEPASFDFGDLNVGERKDKVLKITNNSIVAVKCSLCKSANLETTPKEVWLKSEKSQEFLLSLTPQSLGTFRTKMKVQVFAKSDVAFNSNKSLEMIAVYTVNFTYTAKEVSAILQPKIGLGITPLITNDVGLHRDLITFKDVDKLPFAAVLGLKQGFKPTWMFQEEDQLNNVENALVALPNDRPNYFSTWPKDKICRAIFTGFFRYSPPEDLSYTFSPEERSKKENHCAIWIDYIKLLRKLRLQKIELKNLKCHIEYDLSCKKSYHLKLMKPNVESLSTFHQECKMISKRSESVLKNALVPLSSLYLIRISVQPKLINFGMVAVSTKAQELVSINNTNNFPVSVKFSSGNSAVSVMDDSTFTVQPMSTKSVYVLFETKALGRYFGFLNYIINSCHEFKISIFAFVTPKVLVIKSEDLSIEIGKYEPKDAFQPRSIYLPVENPTQSPVKYRWGFASDSVFTTEIMQGEIPPRSELLTEILYNLNPKTAFYSEVKFISENGTENLIKLIQPNKKVAVYFLNGKVNMRDIPLNLPTKVKAVIQNSCYHDVVFEVTSANPMPGITVGPKRGMIKRRSSFALEINVQIPVIMKFSFEIHVIVHFSNRISATVTGKIVPPNIRMRPSEVFLRKICVQSFEIFTVCVENIGTTPAEVTIDLQSYPEFKIEKDQAKMYLFPKKSSKVLIRFEPENAARYIFYLPVILNNILGPPSLQTQDTELVSFYISKYEELYQSYENIALSKIPDLKVPCVTLNSNVTACLLKISPLSLSFKADHHFCSGFQPLSVEISNVFMKEVIFCIRDDDLGEMNNSPFNLRPITRDNVENRLKSIRVELKPNEKLILTATFEPKKPGSYAVEIPVFVKGYNEGFVYNYIRMSGELEPPKIHPDVSEIHFPPVPLSVGNETVLTVTAKNYHNSDLIKTAMCNLWEEESEGAQHCITTEWLQEPQISARDKNNVFRLRVKFESFFPVALRGYILFIDSTGAYASVLVTAVADNSVVTNYAFLSSKSLNYKIIRDTTAVQKTKPDELIKYPIKKSYLKSQEKVHKPAKKTKSKSYTQFPHDETSQNSSSVAMSATNNPTSLPIDKGPRLVIQMTRSMSRITELRFVNIHRNLEISNEEVKSIFSIPKKNSLNSSLSLPDSQTSTTRTPVHLMSSSNSLVRRDSPTEEDASKYFPKTRCFVERWIFEVVMRCEQYFLIPESFQRVKEVKAPPSKGHAVEKTSEAPAAKDFLDFLKEFVGNDRSLPERPNVKANYSGSEKVNGLRTFFGDILKYLQKKGCLLPHVRPEYLLEFEFYSEYIKLQEKYVELFSWSSYEVKKGNSSKAILEQQVAKALTKKESVLEQNSSMFFARDSWKKLLFEEFSLAPEVDLDKVAEGNLESAEMSKQYSEWTWDLIGKQFEHEVETLDQETFEVVSTQAWLDIIVQIFRVFALKKVVPKNSIPQVMAFEMNDKIPTESTNLRSVRNYGKKTKEGWVLDVESFSSNIYSCQEKTLFSWLNEHIQTQKGRLWEFVDECSLSGKVVSNFDKDLSDSVALLSVTASHCPYIVSTHLKDVFWKPDTPNKIQHNAGKLIEAWRTLEIGLTLETSDIVRPNAVYMTMLVTHLYEVLPTLHPNSLICFSAPLNAEVSRKIYLKNESDKRMILKPKFFGEHEGFFSLTEPFITLKPSSVTSVNVKFTAKKIKNVSAVLVLSGCAVSPHFAKSLAFYLEGEPSEIPECEKFIFSAPLYKVICSEVPLNPPFPDPTTYEVWYTTKQPEFNGCPEVETLFAPWSKVSKRKLSRRLFINKDEIEIQENVPTTLSVTMACFTNEKRSFWLLFRSKISDFIIQIEIKPKVEDQIVVTVFQSESWTPSATCLCPTEGNLKPSNCPFLTELKIPMRNENLWNALRTMFFKALLPQEKPFWNKHFEMDIGLCLILWLLNPDEEEEVLEEFVQVLPTKVNYNLNIQPGCDFVTIPSSVEILDVREHAEVVVPLHISMEAPETFSFQLTMVSENAKEIRNLKVNVQPCDSGSAETPTLEEPKIINFLCQPVGGENGKLCRERKKNKMLKISVSKLKNREINLSS